MDVCWLAQSADADSDTDIARKRNTTAGRTKYFQLIALAAHDTELQRDPGFWDARWAGPALLCRCHISMILLMHGDITVLQSGGICVSPHN